MSARGLFCRVGLALPCALACALASAASVATAAEAATPSPAPRIELVTLPSPQSPIVAIRAFFRTGSIDDPAGKEGLANLTASVVGEGATAKRSYKDLVEALYPLAASIATRVDREVTVFSLVVHREKLDEATALLAEVLTQPGFDANDLERHRRTRCRT
jgi:zinc protease